MERICQYVLSVVCAAFVIGILSSFFDNKGSSGRLLKLIGGLFLLFTIISPVVRPDFSGIWDFLNDCAVEGNAAAAWGEELADEEYRTIIKSRTEAYILDKAVELGLSMSVEVRLSDDEIPAPADVVLRGTASPYAKTKLQQMMTEDLGIAKEKQIWIG